jgi:hypothetical protein
MSENKELTISSTTIIILNTIISVLYYFLKEYFDIKRHNIIKDVHENIKDISQSQVITKRNSTEIEEIKNNIMKIFNAMNNPPLNEILIKSEEIKQ